MPYYRNQPFPLRKDPVKTIRCYVYHPANNTSHNPSLYSYFPSPTDKPPYRDKVSTGKNWAVSVFNLNATEESLPWFPGFALVTDHITSMY